MSGGNPPPYEPEKTPYPPAQPQQGYPAPQQGYPAPQQGYPAPQQGYPAPQQGYPAPQQGYPPPGAPVQAQPVTNVQIVTPSFGKTSQNICCTNCKTQQVTVIRQKVGLMNWLICGVIALVLLLFGFVCCTPFALIALCISSFKDVEHVCPNCDYVNGTHKAL